MVNLELADAMAVRTKQNTEFTAWWGLYNNELVKRGLPEAGFGDALGCYEVGESPETAADYIANS